jgi:hypothetical protein
MANMSRIVALALITVLVISGMLWVGSVSAQSTPKPSIPELSLTLVDGAVRVTIKNQPYVSYNDSEGHVFGLFYHLRMRDSAENNWHFFTYPVGGYRAPDYFPASDSEYTTMDIPYFGNSLGFNWVDFTISSGKADFEVEALGGNSSLVNMSELSFQGSIDDYGYIFHGELSGWSDSQTIQFAYPQVTPTPLPTVSPTQVAPVDILTSFGWEKVAVIGLVAAVAILAVAVAMLWRRLPKK